MDSDNQQVIYFEDDGDYRVQEMDKYNYMRISTEIMFSIESILSTK